jgi:hypothetical protein
MPRVYPARTVLAQRIRERRLTFEEFSERLEVFACENNEVGTVSIRHVQRLAAGQFTSDRLRPATVRLLEKFFESPIDELLVSPETDDLAAQGSDLLAQADPTRHMMSEDGRAVAPAVDLVPAAARWSGSITMSDVDASLWWMSVDTVEIVSRFTRRDLTLDRREATHLFAGVVFGGALLEPLERWLLGAMEKPRAGLAGSVGYQEVTQIENAAWIFRDWDDQFGGGLRRKAVVGQLSEVADLLRDSHPIKIQQRLFGAMAQLAETAAMMSWDSGHQALAQRYYVLALRASKAADDRVFGANIMASMARQLLYLDHPRDALDLVRLAQDDSAGYVTASVRSMLYTREAWAYAKLGRISAFQRATDKAEDALTEARPAEDPYWVTYFDLAELQGTTGGRLLGLAHHDKQFADEAVERISQAITLRRPGRLRSSALDQIGLAEARLIQGEMDEASRLANQAAALAEQTPSDRVRVKLVGLYRHSNAYANIPVIADMRDRIRPLCAAAPI